MRRLVAILLVFFTIASHAYCQGTMTTMGTDFWFTFMDNTDPRQGNNMLTVYISSPNNCSVTLNNPNTGWSTTANVVPGTVSTIHIPQVQGYSTSTSTLLNTGIHLTASDTVSVYISTQGIFSFDECNVLPTNTLRDKYMIQSYPSDWYGSEFVVLAVEDSTWVDIHLSDATSDGAAANSTLSVFFPSAGKSYQLKTPSVGDFTGTRVEARDCKKIAVFHGDVCVYIPNHDAASCDHVLEQAIPIYYWGQHFVAVGCCLPNFPDRVRITALNDSCIVYKNNFTVCTLASGQTHEYALYSNSYNHGYDYISTSEPASVNIFFSSTGSATGDPSMLNIRPLEQTVNNITFNTFNTDATNLHYITVTLRAVDAPLLQVDGNTVTLNYTTVSANNDYKFTTISLYNGSHTLSMNGGNGFVAHAFGLGNHESYAYTLGSSMNDLSSTIYVNGTPVSLNNTFNFCRNDTIDFSVSYGSTPDTVIWNFGDGNTQGGDSVSHAFGTTGLFHVTCQLTSNDSCLYSGTKNVQISIHDTDTIQIDTLCCDSLFFWHGTAYTDDDTISYLQTNTVVCDSLFILDLKFGQATYNYTADTSCSPMAQDTVLYISHGPNSQGCDSLEIMALTVFPIHHTTDEIEGCDSILLDGVWYTTNSRAQITLLNQYGCDSIVNTNIIVHPSYDNTLNITLHEGDTITWIDGNEYYDSMAVGMVFYQTIDGCDSIVRLNIHMLQNPSPPPMDSSSIWVPNVFTPEGLNNTSFKVFSNDIISMKVHIYSRVGLEVCEFDGLTEEWDGKANGQICKEDAYVYMIEYVTKNKPEYTQHKIGTVLLLK